MNSLTGESGADHDSPALSCDRVTKEYTGMNQSVVAASRSRQAVTAIEDVSLSIAHGEVTALVGPSGSGKTTLLHLLAALETPTAGTIRIKSHQVEGLSERKRAAIRLRHIGIVFQRFHLLPALSARGNVTVPLIEQGVARNERITRADRLLSAVDLGDRVNHTPQELSGGEQQRVAIARALVNDPEIVIADEPTGELDSDTGRRVMDTITEVAEDRAVVVATHDEMVVNQADRTVRLRDGAVTDE